MTVLTIAALNLRRTLRERTNIFFVVLFPLLMIMVLGLAFGGRTEPRVAVVADESAPLAGGLTSALDGSGVHTVGYADRAAAVGAVETGRVESALILPASYDARLSSGADVRIAYVSRADRSAQQVAMIVRSVVDRQAARVRVARTLQDRIGGSFAADLQRGDATAASMQGIAVRTTTVGTALFPANLGRFDLGASGMLLLFIFVTSMTTAAALIETRQLGVARRMLAAPTRVRSIVAGEALGRIGTAVVQGAVIMLGAAVLFRVTWGQPLAAVLLMTLFATVAGAAGMLLGSVARTPQQAIATGLLVGIGLSALGGTMMPLELYSPTLRTVAHITPHAWAADAFATLVRHGGNLADILPELAILAGYAAVLFAAASWVLRLRLLNP